MKKNIILILGSLIISLLIIEIFFRLFYPVNMQSYYGEIIDPNKKFVSLKKTIIIKLIDGIINILQVII